MSEAESETTFEAPEGADVLPDEEEAEHEAERPDVLDAPDESAAVPAPPQTGVSDLEMERTMKKLERSATTWRNRVSELLGEAAQDLTPCELCLPIVPGFHWPAEAEQPRDATHARLLSVLLTPEGPTLLPANNAGECNGCAGFGKVLSGSKVPEYRSIVCTQCNGRGYLSGGHAPANGDAAGAFVGAATSTQPDDLDTGDVDTWGIPRLLEDGAPNPNFGRTPQYWDHNYPVGRMG